MVLGNFTDDFFRSALQEPSKDTLPGHTRTIGPEDGLRANQIIKKICIFHNYFVLFTDLNKL